MITPDESLRIIKRFEGFDEVSGLRSDMRQTKCRQLLLRFCQQTKNSLPETPEELYPFWSACTHWLTDNIASQVSHSTYKIYRNALIPLIPYTNLGTQLRNTKGQPAKNMRKNTSAGRQKYLSDEQLNALSDYIHQHKRAGSWAHIIPHWLHCTRLTGLRPDEWFYTTLEHHLSRPFLKTRTHKLESEKANHLHPNIVKDEMLQFCFPYRGVPLDHLHDTEMTMINSLLMYCENTLDSYSPREAINAIQKALRQSIIEVWGRNGPSIHLYSARHQFVANLKNSDVPEHWQTYLLGQQVDDTKHRHYAHQRHASQEAVPKNIAPIAEYVQDKYNEAAASS